MILRLLVIHAKMEVEYDAMNSGESGCNELLVDFQVLGNAKGAVAVVVSILIFRNPVSVTGMAGYTLTVIGVILYSEAKKRSNK